MKVVGLATQKGGAGKSAAAINLACSATAEGYKAGIIDLDESQWTASRWARRRSKDLPSITVIPTDLIHLPESISDLAHAGTEWTFLDLPGRNSPTASVGMLSANFILVAARPNDVDLEAAITTVKAAGKAKKQYAFLLTFVPAHTQRAQRVADALRNAGHPTCPVFIPQRVEVADAIGLGRGVNELKQPGPAAERYKELFTWLQKQIP